MVVKHRMILIHSHSLILLIRNIKICLVSTLKRITSRFYIISIFIFVEVFSITTKECQLKGTNSIFN